MNLKYLLSWLRPNPDPSLETALTKKVSSNMGSLICLTNPYVIQKYLAPLLCAPFFLLYNPFQD